MPHTAAIYITKISEGENGLFWFKLLVVKVVRSLIIILRLNTHVKNTYARKVPYVGCVLRGQRFEGTSLNG